MDGEGGNIIITQVGGGVPMPHLYALIPTHTHPPLPHLYALIPPHTLPHQYALSPHATPICPEPACDEVAHGEPQRLLACYSLLHEA